MACSALSSPPQNMAGSQARVLFLPLLCGATLMILAWVGPAVVHAGSSSLSGRPTVAREHVPWTQLLHYYFFLEKITQADANLYRFVERAAADTDLL